MDGECGMGKRTDHISIPTLYEIGIRDHADELERKGVINQGDRGQIPADRVPDLPAFTELRCSTAWVPFVPF